MTLPNYHETYNKYDIRRVDIANEHVNNFLITLNVETHNDNGDNVDDSVLVFRGKIPFSRATFFVLWIKTKQI